ncbi:MAG: hypothetical protein GC203_15785 [Phenylobacterium sp.]|uniref:surface-adhesin E family protein n=1 Tax=Phenylobacterium sp. TaxID=1871053 RepID=UPI0025F499BB|nr:surface-adhesin E family protein [Phenylobacterium sp.]MBI1199321.1 hypothetical protein [Phenylobacterium sp.]
MRRTARLIAGLAGLAAAAVGPAATAATFYVVQSGHDAWTIMDPAGIEQVDPSVRRAWAVRVQRNILNGDPPQPGYVRTLSEYNCDTDRVRWREFSAFSRSGALLASKVNPNPEWGPADEATDLQSAFRVVCRGGGGATVIAAESVAKVVISLMSAWDPPPAAPTAPPAAKPR